MPRWIALLFLLVPGTALAGTISAEFAGKWVYPRETLTIELGEDFEAQAGELRVFAGTTDVTALTSVAGPRRLAIDPAASPLPEGPLDIVVWQIGPDRQWTEYGRIEALVLTAGGFEVSEFDPVGQLNNKGQLDEGHTASAPASEPRTYQNLAGQAGWTTRHARGGFELRTRASFFGSSRRAEALRFGEDGAAADKFDLSDYLIELQRGDSVLALGHVNYGRHPLLHSGIGNRGIVFTQRLGQRFDFSIASQNGTSVVGFSNFAGLRTFEHNISGAAAGIEVFRDEPGKLRIELSWLDAKISSQVDFDTGEVPDAETSRGLGGRLLANFLGGRARGDFVLARTRYDNPEDPLLAQGDQLVPVAEETKTAWTGRLDLGVLQGWPAGASWPMTLNLGVQRGYTDPLYRSLAASVTPDLDLWQYDLNGQIGVIGLMGLFSIAEDNLDDIPTILKTRTGNTHAALSLPLSSIFPVTGAWLPTLALAYQRVRQYAINSPGLAESGFNGTNHLPDQKNRAYGVNATWSFGRIDVGYAFNVAEQDNRQLGRDLADFENRTQSVNLGLRLLDWVGTTFDLSRTRAFDRERALVQYTDGGGVSLNAQWRTLSFSGSYSTSRGHDSAALSENRSHSGNAQLGWSFTLPNPWREMPGQVFVSYQRARNVFSEVLFGVTGDNASWAITSGLSLTLF